MNLLLICETNIIEHIFTLVCKRLNINLTSQKTTNVYDKYDLIVIDQSFDKARDFIIPRPFLPTSLEKILLEQIKFIKEEKEQDKNNKRISFSKNSYEEDEEVTVPVVNYVNSLEEEEHYKKIATFYDEDDSYDEEDESIVHLDTLKSSGILDHRELNKINDILREETIQNEINLEKNDWKDIASIIDDALEEVKDYEFDLNKPPLKPYNLILSNFNINELRPLLEKFDQTVIDKLSSGETVDVRISLKEK